MAQCNLSRNEFLELTPGEFVDIVKEVQERKTGEYRAAWERARLTGWLAFIPHVKSEDRAKVNTPEKLIKFTWEKKGKKDDDIKPEKIDWTKIKELYKPKKQKHARI